MITNYQDEIKMYQHHLKYIMSTKYEQLSPKFENETNKA